MKSKKTGIELAVLGLAVGFAAVSTTLYINGTSTVKKNDGDFKVYYSNAKVNGIQDLTVVESESSLKFTTTLDTLGQTYVLDYDVTNGSKNYDADLEMVCTGGNEYLTVTNVFDDATILEALKTRSGKLTLTLAKSYTGDDLDVTIQCNIKANAVERNSLGSGTAASPVKSLCKWIYSDTDNDGTVSIGDEYKACNEVFNIIDISDNNVKMLAKLNVVESRGEYNQTKSTYVYEFSDVNGWEYTPGPVDIDLQLYDGPAKDAINGYSSYLENYTIINNIDVNLITLAELKKLGCVINDDYSFNKDATCANSEYGEWLINGQKWYTRSVYTGYSSPVWYLYADGGLSGFGYHDYTYGGGFRPVITISKDVLNNHLGNEI